MSHTVIAEIRSPSKESQGNAPNGFVYAPDELDIHKDIVRNVSNVKYSAEK